MHQRTGFVVCGLLLILSPFGCDKPMVALAPTPKPDEFQQLLDVSMQELKLKTEAHKAWGLGTFDRWDIDQEVGDLVFSNDDGTTAVAPAQIIGSFSTNDNSWLWAWDNPSILDGLKRDSRKLKEYGERHGIEKLTTRKWTGTEEDAWDMAALAVKLCGAQGAYRGPAGPSYVFMTFGEVKISKSNDGQ
ncbi:MAG: hypothetical protein SH850_04330 [Planctomycetaceae bacterium]|nr:hypothetical protein [Planctomycetaceae bacterium]